VVRLVPAQTILTAYPERAALNVSTALNRL